MPPKPLTELLGELDAIRARQSIKGRLVHMEEWQDGRRVIVPYILVGGQPVRLTDQQLSELKGDHHG